MKDYWFTLDKVEHLLLFIWLSFVLCRWFNWLAVIIICFVIGFLIELLETTDFWDKLMKWMGEREGKAPISGKDLVVNLLGSIMGVIARV